jgi:hypothetical protein
MKLLALASAFSLCFLMACDSGQGPSELEINESDLLGIAATNEAASSRTKASTSNIAGKKQAIPRDTNDYPCTFNCDLYVLAAASDGLKAKLLQKVANHLDDLNYEHGCPIASCADNFCVDLSPDGNTGGVRKVEKTPSVDYAISNTKE